eukprot:CAMPEP_0198730220 /NCGR_PEP_ID=MMETSP1475-20131203/23473_1 /TAXON_ID= ORGANISM="Unidentified sp., Strain CCMP1999" /NCGR_SAMPLE_ID=MMETSP1475 /ASSEMBLY_ACC=CAM_ASM_001111 /LENGTH=159 /DNA_ID=CAMNT_0044493003 /DNA_START=84 /DNA_END=563 /DNA_ORIENTATION=-
MYYSKFAQRAVEVVLQPDVHALCVEDVQTGQSLQLVTLLIFFDTDYTGLCAGEGVAGLGGLAARKCALRQCTDHLSSTLRRDEQQHAHHVDSVHSRGAAHVVSKSVLIHVEQSLEKRGVPHSVQQPVACLRLQKNSERTHLVLQSQLPKCRLHLCLLRP